MKDLTRNAASELAMVASDVGQLRNFVDNNISQFALLGIQILWTMDMQGALEQIRSNKKAMPMCTARANRNPDRDVPLVFARSRHKNQPPQN